MATRTVQINALTPGDLILIRGKVAYSHIASRIEGDELQKSIDRAKQSNRIPVEKPHTTLSITNAQIILHPEGKTSADVYAEESLYTKRTEPNAGYCYQAYNKGNGLPEVDVYDPTSGKYKQVEALDGELAVGLDVTLVLEVFRPKNRMNNGLALEAVLVNEPIRYYSFSDTHKKLAERGIVCEGVAAKVKTTDATPMADSIPASQMQQVAPSPAPQTAQTAAPFGEPVQAPIGNPYSSQQQTNNFMNQPVTPVAPAPSPAPAPAPQTQATGIQYNPAADRQY